MAKSNTEKTWKSTCSKFFIIVLLPLLVCAVVYLTITRFQTSPAGSIPSNNEILLEDVMPSLTSTPDSSDTIDSPTTPLSSTSSSAKLSAGDFVYSDIGDVISLIVPETQDVISRIRRAKTLKHEGRNDTALSDALIDLLGFESKCEFPDGETEKDRAEKGQRRPDFDALHIVHSSPSHGNLRNIIRNTWGSPEQCRRYRVLLRFVMGSPRTDLDVHLLKNESDTFGDILVGNFTDKVTRASTFKSLLAIRWALSLPCPLFGFIIYSEDHTFMMLEKLPDLLSSFQDPNQFKSIYGSRVIYHVDLHPADYHNGNPLLERDFYPPTCYTDIGCISPFVLATELYTKFIWTTRVPLSHYSVVLGLAAEEYHWEVRHSDVFSSQILKRSEQACFMKTRCTATIHNIDLIQLLWEILSDPQSMDNCG